MTRQELEQVLGDTRAEVEKWKVRAQSAELAQKKINDDQVRETYDYHIGIRRWVWRYPSLQ